MSPGVGTERDERDGVREGAGRERRRYHSPLRRQQAARTRERIVAAGSDLAHSFPRWDWRELTFRAVAERAGVSERTVYRYFATERELHEAVMRRLEAEAGVSYDDLALDGLADAAARTFASLPSFAVSPLAVREPDDPVFAAGDQRRREAFLRAVAAETAHWSDAERQMAAGVLDVLSSLPCYERLVTSWKLSPEQATAAAAWAVGLLVDAIRGRRPHAPDPAGAAPAGSDPQGSRPRGAGPAA